MKRWVLDYNKNFLLDFILPDLDTVSALLFVQYVDYSEILVRVNTIALTHSRHVGKVGHCPLAMCGRDG